MTSHLYRTAAPRETGTREPQVGAGRVDQCPPIRDVAKDQPRLRPPEDAPRWSTKDQVDALMCRGKAPSCGVHSLFIRHYRPLRAPAIHGFDWYAPGCMTTDHTDGGE